MLIHLQNHCCPTPPRLTPDPDNTATTNHKTQLQQHPPQPVTSSAIAPATHVAITAKFSIPTTENDEEKIVENRGRAILGSVTITQPSPPSWFAGEPEPDSLDLLRATERQFMIVTFAATSSVGSMDHPAVDLFCFDPGRNSSETSHRDTPTVAKEDNMAVLRRVMVAASSSPFPPRTSPSSASPAPPSSVPYSPATTTVSLPTVAPSLGAASCWPWVPWSFSIWNG